MVDEQFESETMAQPFQFRVYLPPCYQEDQDRRYPVLYLLHGQTYSSDQWDRLGVDETAERLAAAGEIPPFLMIFPYDRDWRQPDEAPFGKALAEELVPWVDAHYRTLAGREYRAIGGLSRGAGWAVHLGFSHSDLFAIVGAHSLALFWVDGPLLPVWMRDTPDGQLPRTYLDIGRDDRELKSTMDFAGLLDKYEVPHEWHLNTGFHDEDYWSSHVEQYLRFYTADW